MAAVRGSGVAATAHTVDCCHLYRLVDVVRIRFYMVAFALASL